MPIPVYGTCFGSRSRANPRYQSISNIFPGRGMAFRHKRLSLLLAFHFRPISSERTYSYYPILIHPPFSGSSQLPCRHLITQPATSSSQPPWRSFPSVLTDVSLFDTFDICPLLWPKLTCLCCLATLPLTPGLSTYNPCMASS